MKIRVQRGGSGLVLWICPIALAGSACEFYDRYLCAPCGATCPEGLICEEAFESAATLCASFDFGCLKKDEPIDLNPSAAACSARIDLPPPAVERVLLFWPLDGVVHGFGLPEALPSGTAGLKVAARRPGFRVETLASLALDGTFRFELPIDSFDLVMLTASDARGACGAPALLRVPPSPRFFRENFFCCPMAEGSICNPESLRGKECVGLRLEGVNDCVTDDDCLPFSGIQLALNREQIDFLVRPDNESVEVTSVGFGVEPLSLISGRIGSISKAVIVNQVGHFTLEVPIEPWAKELELELFNLEGDRSKKLILPLTLSSTAS